MRRVRRLLDTCQLVASLALEAIAVALFGIVYVLAIALIEGGKAAFEFGAFIAANVADDWRRARR